MTIPVQVLRLKMVCRAALHHTCAEKGGGNRLIWNSLGFSLDLNANNNNNRIVTG